MIFSRPFPTIFPPPHTPRVHAAGGSAQLCRRGLQTHQVPPEPQSLSPPCVSVVAQCLSPAGADSVPPRSPLKFIPPTHSQTLLVRTEVPASVTCISTAPLPSNAFIRPAWILLVLLLAVAPLRAQSSSSWLCGLYSLHALARQLGLQPDFQTLLKPDFVRSPLGSSAADLEKAAAFLGLAARTYPSLTLAGLRAAGLPAVLHVKATPSSATYAHWMALLRFEEGYPVIFDPPYPPARWAPADLLAVWDGTAILVAPDTSQLRAAAVRLRLTHVRTSILLLLALLGCFAANALSQRWTVFHRRPFSHPITQALAILIIATGTGLAAHSLRSDGFLRSPNTLQSLAQAYTGQNLPFIDPEHFRALLKANLVIPVDTRFPEEYQHRHLAGAIHLNMLQEESTWRTRLKGIDPRRTLVLYDRGQGCSDVHRAAQRLKYLGYSSIAILRGGFRALQHAGFPLHPSTQNTSHDPDS